MTQTARWESTFFPSLFFFKTKMQCGTYGEHLHDTLEIGWALTDNFMLGVRDCNYQMKHGDAVVIAPREMHSGNKPGSNSVSFATLHIPPAVLGQLFASNLLDAEHIIGMPSVRLIDSTISLHVYREMINSLPYTGTAEEQLRCLGRLLSQLFEMKRDRTKVLVKTKHHPVIEHVKSVINSGYEKNINFSNLAAEVDLHERYLISLFKSATGTPPHRYQIALRVERGRQMLEKNIALTDVASATGFCDQSHFNRYFKRSYGIPPGLFRKSIHTF